MPGMSFGFCCMDHMKRFTDAFRRENKMPDFIDPTKSEMTSLHHGGRMGGEYLQSIGVYDLSQLSPEQWEQFLKCVLGGYFEKIADLNDDIPF
jgi:hypothetical protein